MTVFFRSVEVLSVNKVFFKDGYAVLFEAFSEPNWQSSKSNFMGCLILPFFHFLKNVFQTENESEKMDG